MMTPQAAAAEALYSAFGADPDLGDLVELFVEETPTRCRAMREALDNKEWIELERMAHQLKGAAGSYGFDQLTPYAAKLEYAIKTRADEAQLAQTLDELLDRCRLLRAGIPPAKAR